MIQDHQTNKVYLAEGMGGGWRVKRFNSVVRLFRIPAAQQEERKEKNGNLI